MSSHDAQPEVYEQGMWTREDLIRRLRLPCYRCLGRAKGGLKPGYVYFGCTDCRDRMLAASELEMLGVRA